MELSGGPFSIPLLRKYNIWYSINDGNWSNANTWISNGLDKKNHTSPQPGDTVFIDHTVTLDTTISIKNIYISGTFKADNLGHILTVTGDMQATGSVDFTGSNVTVALNGVNNFIVSFTCGASSIIQYTSSMTQPVMPITYRNLSLLGGTAAVKYLQANLTVNSNLITNSILNTNGFDISVSGTTTHAGQIATINSTTNILFVGLVSFGGGGVLNIVGAASVECRGGVTAAAISSFWSSANVNFTTNNQTITTNGATWTINNLTITGAITINTSASDSQALVINGVVNGTVAGSTLNNDGIIQFNSTNTVMTTGVFNSIHTAGSTIIYNINGAYTLPLTTYEKLTIQGTGTKTVSGNLTINSNMLINGGILDLGANNLTVTGTTIVQSITGALNKTGAGTMLFIGQFSTGTGSVNSDWSAGNPSVEFRGGVSLANGSVNTGSGTVSFTTNNQTFSNGMVYTWTAPILIAAGITLTYTSTQINHSGTINGASSTSIFDNRGTITYTSATAPMSTGNLYCNQATNTFIYGLAGNQDIQVPSDPVSPGYKNLTLNGSGAKKLLGNVSVKGVYTLTGPATLNSNGFALTNP